MTTALLAHLLQSTICVAVAWLLTLALHRYPARVRFWVWLSASLKFVFPFALLTSLGALWAKPQPQSIHPALYTVMEEFSEPFAKANVPAVIPATQAHSAAAGTWISIGVAALWALGCLIMLLRWARQWQSARRMVNDADTLHEGLEIDVLRSLEAEAQMRKPISIVVTSRAVEPGVFGVVRPVLLWPAGLSGRLDEAQIRSVLAHELEHVRRHDNLSSTIQSLVEAIFWFHPAVYWMRSKMNDERERACDESVIARSAQPEKYAESILKVCAFCLESPLQCVAGISGSDLKKRVLRIMNPQSGVSLTFARRALLAGVVLLAVTLPVGLGVVRGQEGTAANSKPADSDTTHDLPKYEVASVKPTASSDGRMMTRITPDGTSIEGLPVQFLLQEAFSVEKDRIIGAPAWTESKRFDIDAKVAPEDAPKLEKLKNIDRNRMLIPVLAERFGLQYHHEMRELPLYALVIAKGGPRLTASKPGSAQAQYFKDGSRGPGNPPPPPPPPGNTSGKPGNAPGRMMYSPGHIEGNDVSINMLVQALSPQLGFSTVVDKTGLTGQYDFTLQWTPDNAPPPTPGGQEGDTSAGVSLFTAIQEQLGLKLESEKDKVDVIVIDHINLPSAN